MVAEINSVIPEKNVYTLCSVLENGKFYKIPEKGIVAIYTSPDYTRVTFRRKSINEKNINLNDMEINGDLLCFHLKTNSAISIANDSELVIIRHIDPSEIRVRRPRTKTIRDDDRF